MRLAWGPAEEAFREELLAFLDAHAPPEARVGRDWESAAEGGEIIPRWLREWQATLFDHGWMVPSYPPELGGRNATPVQSLIYTETLAERGIPRSGHFPGYAIVAPSLLEFGTPEQKELVRPAIRGDTVWCIGMSEPGAGSDLASLSTRAELRGDRFVVNGQKVWTSYATVAEKCFCYVRTTPLSEAPKHKGISVLIIDMDTPGIEVRPLRHITGAAEFAEVFFTDVEVPATNLVGRLNDGWRITMASLGHERGGLWVQGVATCEHALGDLVALARKLGLDADPTVRRRLGAAYAQVRSLRALGYKGFASFARGSAAPEHSLLKLATSETGKALFELGMDLLGPYGVVVDPERGEQAGRWPRSFFVSFASTIAGGTSEIQRNIIAERVLGLPRG
jgi:alkylation response protein AidB-like acyl-CoA dehydrogenase